MIKNKIIALALASTLLISSCGSSSASSSVPSSSASVAQIVTFEEALALKSSEIVKITIKEHFQAEQVYETIDRAKIDKIVEDLSTQKLVAYDGPPLAGSSYIIQFYTDTDSYKEYISGGGFNNYNLSVGLIGTYQAEDPAAMSAILSAFYLDLKA